MYIHIYISPYFSCATEPLSCKSYAYHRDGFNEECPAPPELDYEDIYTNTTGPLDSDNTFVAEYLLRKATKRVPSVFFQEVQAGFVFGYNEPMQKQCDNETYSVSQVYFADDDQSLTATIWYNNQVG